MSLTSLLGRPVLAGRGTSGTSVATLRGAALAVLFTLLVAGQGKAWAGPELPSLPHSVNVNTADATTIAAVLNGVGLSRAAAIIAYREQHGAFSRIEDLTNVKGVGQRTLDRNAGRIRVED